MPDSLDELLWAVTVGLPVALAFYYFGLPLLVRSSQRFPAHPDFRVLDLKSIKPAVARFLAGHAATLLELGFDEPTHLRIPNAATDVTAYLIVLVNRSTGDKVMVTVLIGDSMPPIETWYVEFSTSYDSGESFDTLNSSELNAFPVGPRGVRTQVPSVRDVEELLELHRFVMAKHAPAGKPWVYEPGTLIEYLTEYAFLRPYDRQVARGTLYFDAPDDAYRLTVVGAYRVAWGLLQPMKWLRERAVARAEGRILDEFRRSRI